MSTYRIDGMTCQGCANAVTKAIQAAAPKAKIAVDLAAKTVTVDDVVAVDAVRAAVQGAGFTYVGKA
jgi:copper chaperone